VLEIFGREKGSLLGVEGEKKWDEKREYGSLWDTRKKKEVLGVNGTYLHLAQGQTAKWEHAVVGKKKNVPLDKILN